MAQYHITVNNLHGLFTRDEGLAKLLEQVLNPILEAQVEEQLGARRDERTEERKRLSKRFVSTPADNPGGTVDLARSTDQRWEFSTELFQRYQRSEQALVLALMEMVVNGVSI